MTAKLLISLQKQNMDLISMYKLKMLILSWKIVIFRRMHDRKEVSLKESNTFDALVVRYKSAKLAKYPTLFIHQTLQLLV